MATDKDRRAEIARLMEECWGPAPEGAVDALIDTFNEPSVYEEVLTEALFPALIYKDEEGPHGD